MRHDQSCEYVIKNVFKYPLFFFNQSFIVPAALILCILVSDIKKSEVSYPHHTEAQFDV